MATTSMKLNSGSSVFLTGASGGIGTAIAELLAPRGVVLGLAARREEPLRQLAARLPGEHEIFAADVSDPAAIGAAVDSFAARHGLDVVIANAGIATSLPLSEQPLSTIEEMTATNWLGTVYTVKAALPHLKKAGRGQVVVMCSSAGLRSFPSAASHAATKAAQRLFADALWHELEGTGVGVTTVFPGEYDTGIHDHDQETLPEWYVDLDSGRRPPAELARRLVRGVERDARHVYSPRRVWFLGAAHGLSPRLGDLLARRVRGRAAAPR